MKKAIIISYGIVAYLLFLFTILYAVGFLGNLLVPKSINSGTEASFLPSIIINTLLLSLFAVQHSVMARPAFKKWLNNIIDPAIERSTYVLLSSAALMLIFWQWQPMKTIIWEVENYSLAAAILVVYFLGWLITFLSSCIINHFQLFGLSQVFNRYKNKQSPDPPFQIKYFYTLVRHPIMLGYLIAFWATPLMTYGHLLFSLITSIYILIAVKYLEEKDLAATIGQQYKDYQKQVPMILPFTKRPKP